MKLREFIPDCGIFAAGAVFFVVFSMLLVLTTNESLALQEGNPQCGYGTNALDVDSGGVRVIPTFHSLGVYWSPSNPSANDAVHVLFREAGSTDPERRSLNLAYSPDDAEYRGSIVHLKSGTQYEMTLVRGGIEQETVVAETWCEQFPVAETRYIPTGVQNSPFVIADVVG